MPTREELEAAYCWDREDDVPRRPEMTDFRRRYRLHQARWREREGHPIGSQPIAPKGNPARPVGNRLPLDYARETGANFITSGARASATERLSRIEPNQSIDRQRIWAELLWSPSVAYNLFGDLAANLTLADRAVQACWPDAPSKVTDVRFSHSPGWLDPAYLGSLRAFDTAFLLQGAVVAVNVRYHERAKAETPKPENLERYVTVAKKSRAFARGAIEKLSGRSDLAVTWLEHLLLHSMLQHRSRRWTWGRLVVVYAAENADMADICARYRELLRDESTFAPMTLEELLDRGVLPAADAVRDRYLPA